MRINWMMHSAKIRITSSFSSSSFVRKRCNDNNNESIKNATSNTSPHLFIGHTFSLHFISFSDICFIHLLFRLHSLIKYFSKALQLQMLISRNERLRFQFKTFSTTLQKFGLYLSGSLSLSRSLSPYHHPHPLLFPFLLHVPFSKHIKPQFISLQSIDCMNTIHNWAGSWQCHCMFECGGNESSRCCDGGVWYFAKLEIN